MMKEYIILNVLILIGIIINEIHIHRIEKDNEILKEWIKFCYHIDIDRLSEFVEKAQIDDNMRS